MNRFFVEKKYIGIDYIEITSSDDVHHLARVLRIPVGEAVFISDGEGTGYIAEVSGISKSSVVLKIKEKLEKKERGVTISLACAVPKNAHFEDIVDKCTQLGVSQIIPLITERTIVKKSVFENRRERLDRVMLSAAKQSGVLFLPKISQVMDFSEFLPLLAGYDLKILPYLSTKTCGLKSALASFDGKKILVVIGPEGDFSQSEVDKALSCGCIGVSLGESVLRVDTAAVSAVSFLRLFF